jgi:hypothetical protein
MIPERNLESLTFREKIRDAAHLSRALIEHLEQAVEPKIQQLMGCVRVKPGAKEEDTQDVTVRSLAAAVLESERFAENLNNRLVQYATAIVNESQDILNPQRRAGGPR